MKVLKYVVCILLISSCSKEKLVKGYVVDADNNPIEGVKVLVNSSDIYTLTNEKGFFEIDPNGISDELLFDKQGFQLEFSTVYALEQNSKIILNKTSEP